MVFTARPENARLPVPGERPRDEGWEHFPTREWKRCIARNLSPFARRAGAIALRSAVGQAYLRVSHVSAEMISKSPAF